MQESRYLLEALKLAKIRQGFCAPNPSVGAIVVKNNKILATGYHNGPGSFHAEVDALQKLDDILCRDAALYVTLEPCCHFGRTPPCTNLIREKKISAVYYAFDDPNPCVSGKGAKILQEAGILCEKITVNEVTDFYNSYFYWWKTKKPWVIAKLAMSMDSKIAGCGGKPVTLTGHQLQKFTHQRRKKADAILTTALTIIRDDPQLNVRLAKKTFKKNLFVLDSKLQLPLTAKVFETAEKITIFHQKNVDQERLANLQQKGVECVAVEQDQEGLCLDQVLKEVGGRGVHELWVEGGGRCFESLAIHHLLNEAFIYISPKTLGGDAQTAFTQGGVFSQVKNIKWQPVGEEVICHLEWGSEERLSENAFVNTPVNTSL